MLFVIFPSFAAVNREILRLAVPNILSNFSVPLLSMADTALMGHFAGKEELGAIALGSAIFNFIYWGFGFFRMGTTGLTAQYQGNQNLRETAFTLYRSLTFAVLIGLALIVLQWPILEISMYLIDGSPKVESLTGSYFLIRIMAAPATIGLYAIYGWLLGMQNARLPMVLAIVTNMLNLGLNFIFVLLFNMSSDGVALGTAIAQYFGLISGLALLWHYYRHHFGTGSRQQIFRGKRLTEMFSVNRDIFIRTLCLIFTFTFFTAQSASISNTMLAVNTILLQFTTMLSYAIDGFAIAGESLVGKYLGRGVASTFRRAIRYVFAWGMGLALIFTCIFFFVGEQLLHLFTDKSAITAAATPFLFWIILMPIINSIAYIWDGIYIGATASGAMRNQMLLSTLAIYLPIYYLCTPIFGNHGLWLALLLFMLSRGLILTITSKRNIYSQLNKKGN